MLFGLAALLPALLFAQSQGSAISVSAGTMTTPIDRTKVHLDQQLGSQIPLDATFRDKTGATETFTQLLGNKPSIVIPIFFRCTGVCGVELQGAIAAIKQMKVSKLGKDFNVVVMSIHPKETPDLADGKFKSTVDEVAIPGTEPGWRFVVGDWQNIHKVTDAIGFHYTFDESKPTDDQSSIRHPSGIVFVTPKGVVSSYIYGAYYTARQFERNLDFAGREQVGEKTQEVFFGCVHIDPITGRRSIVMQGVLKVLGTITVSVIAMMILVLSGKVSLRRRRQAA